MAIFFITLKVLEKDEDVLVRVYAQPFGASTLTGLFRKPNWPTQKGLSEFEIQNGTYLQHFIIAVRPVSSLILHFK